MNEKIAFLLNQQINKEFYSAYLYLDMSNYYDDLDLDDRMDDIKLDDDDDLE